MFKVENECVGCPPCMGCLGATCPNANVIHIYCDHCGQEDDEIYHYEDEHWCLDCIKDDLVAVEESEYEQDY